MRNSKKIGPGAAGKKAAQEVAKKIQAHLALGESAFDSLTAGITLEAFAETFLHTSSTPGSLARTRGISKH